MLSKKLALAAVSLVVTFFSVQPVIAADSHQTEHEHHHSADSHANEQEHHHGKMGIQMNMSTIMVRMNTPINMNITTASASLSCEICLVSEHV